MAESHTALRANSGSRLPDLSVASVQSASFSPHPGHTPALSLPVPLAHPMGEGSGVRVVRERGEGETFAAQ